MKKELSLSYEGVSDKLLRVKPTTQSTDETVFGNLFCTSTETVEVERAVNFKLSRLLEIRNRIFAEFYLEHRGNFKSFTNLKGRAEVLQKFAVSSLSG